uniref:J domain-containing protein n=1 Tax=Ditylenchus dipsaci TaxID=166011 RepID=A0A915CMM8_9BILA
MLLVLRLLAFFASQLVGPCIGVGLAPGLYCGLDTCYEALGVERESFNKSELSKIYRKLARQYHPDRVKDPDLVEESEKKFRLIATAYETLKDDETRTYYDYYLDNPEERYYNYYQYYRMRATPKVDVKYVILVAILLISVFQYLSGLQKHTEAMKYAKEQFDKMGKIKKKQKNGTDPELIISGIIEENINISGGYKKQTIYDTLAWQIITLPLILFRYLAWWTVWAKKYWIQKQEYDEEAKLYLIQKHLKINSDQFLALGEKTIDDYMAKQLWKSRSSTTGKRQYKRFLKKNAGSTISFLDE